MGNQNKTVYKKLVVCGQPSSCATPAGGAPPLFMLTRTFLSYRKGVDTPTDAQTEIIMKKNKKMGREQTHILQPQLRELLYM